jgi:hypothetical protein
VSGRFLLDALSACAQEQTKGNKIALNFVRAIL